MGTLYVVATPIGNLGDFSKRAVDTLNNCDLILAEDTRQTIKLLNHFNIKTKMISYHKFNEKKRVDEIISLLENGKNISLVSDAGTPCISDPGYVIVNEVRKRNINIYGIPGCSAVITSLSISGLDTSSFSFYGFVPTDNKDRKKIFEDIKYSKIKTKVLYESPNRMLKLLKDLKQEFPKSIVCVASELTKIHEKCIYGSIEDVYANLENDKESLKGEYVLLISNNAIEKEENKYSIESMIVDCMIKNNYTIKEAINYLNNENDKLSKKDIYNASLNLKKILK